MADFKILYCNGKIKVLFKIYYFITMRISMTLAIGAHTLGYACGLTFLVPRDSSKMNVNNVSHRLLRNLVRPPLNRHLKFPPKIPPLTVKEYVRL